MSAVTPASSSSPAPLSIEREATSASDNHPKKLQLFLGGSCNPTTWRQNVAIPYLEMNGISYYNPQVDNWTPERVDSERFAKQNAQILLFVIDKQTRSTVSIVESAYMAGENKSLVLVIYPFDYNIVGLSDTSKQQTSNLIQTSSSSCCCCSSSRLKKTRKTSNLNESSSFTKSSSSTTSAMLISSTSASAHQASLTSTSTSASSMRATLTSEKISSTSDDCLIDQKCVESKHEEAKKLSSSTIRLSGESISLREFRELEQARSILDKLVKMKKIPTFSDILQALKHVSHCLNTMKSKPSLTTSTETSPIADTQSDKLESLAVDCNTIGEPLELGVTSSNDCMKDIYLSLDSEDLLSLESMVISILEKKGLTYNYTSVNCGLIEPISSTVSSGSMSITPVIVPRHSLEPQQPSPQTGTLDHDMTTTTRYSSSAGVNLGGVSRLSIEKEICAIRSSRVLLFVITNRCRGLSIMVLASHFMALFRQNVVLCIQYLEEPCSIAGESLTKAAIADYNRGRVYLCDYATKSQVPVFSTIQEAIECCSRKCR